MYYTNNFFLIKRTILEKFNTISPGDIDLLHLVDTEDEVLEVLNNFYNEYELSPNF